MENLEWTEYLAVTQAQILSDLQVAVSENGAFLIEDFVAKNYDVMMKGSATD
jgi:hypothetical protein